MKKIIKENKAITLIVLVITVVILIILVGVLINLSIGENGLFTRARLAKQKYEYASAKETLELKLVDIQTECTANGTEYNLTTIAKKFELSAEETIEIMYYYGTAKLNSNVNTKPSTLKGIAVMVDRYPQYEFLLGKKTDGNLGITGVAITTGETLLEIDFTDVEEFEATIFGEVISVGSNSETNITSFEQLLETNNISGEYTMEDILANEDNTLTIILEDTNSAKYLLDNNISSICGSATAMTALGESEAAKELIKNSESYSNAINESEHWKKVYTKCIPQMSNDVNDDDYGTATGSECVSSTWSRAFDKQYGGWPIEYSGWLENSYVQYMFKGTDTGIIPKKIEFYNDSDCGLDSNGTINLFNNGESNIANGMSVNFSNLTAGTIHYLDVPYTNTRYMYFRCTLTSENNTYSNSAYGGKNPHYRIGEFNIYGL